MKRLQHETYIDDQGRTVHWQYPVTNQRRLKDVPSIDQELAELNQMQTPDDVWEWAGRTAARSSGLRRSHIEPLRTKLASMGATTARATPVRSSGSSSLGVTRGFVDAPARQQQICVIPVPHGEHIWKNGFKHLLCPGREATDRDT